MGYSLNHYFIHDGKKHEIRYIEYDFRGSRFRFAVHDCVFSKNHVDYATDILLNVIPPLSGSLLDMGCGYGVIGIVLYKMQSLELTAADVNPAAVELTRINGVENVIESDCFDNIAGRFDTIVINPPIHAGKSVTYKMYEQSLAHLNSGGRLYVVTLKKHGAESTAAKLREVYGGENVQIIYKKKGIFVLECQKSAA
jgi:16S rRNA (guanine1207-N2)-methyltransferase